MEIFVKVDDVVNKDDTGVKVECQEYDSKDQVSTGINPVLENMQQTAMELSLFYWIIVFGFSFFFYKKDAYCWNDRYQYY